MSYRITYGQPGNERDVYNPAAGVYLASCTADFEANVSGVLEMQLPPSHPLLGKMEPMNTDMEVRLYEDDTEILRGRIVSDGDDLDKIGHVKVEDQQAYLNDVNCRPYTTYYVDDQKDQLPIISGNLAQHLIDDYNLHCTAGREFAFYGSEVGDDLRVSTTDEKPVRDELADTIYNAGGFVQVWSIGTSRAIRFLRYPPHGEQVIRVAENMLSYAHERDYSGIVTAIIAKGKGSKSDAETDDVAREEEFGLETISDGEYGAIRIDGDRAISIEGEAKYGIIEDSRSYECSTPQGLFELVERDLANAVIDVESVDIDAYDLHELNPDIKALRLCNVHTIESPSGTFDMMLTEINLDICNPDKSKYHFGRLASSLSRTGVAESSSTRETQRNVTFDANREHFNNAQTNKQMIDGLDQIGDGLVDLEHLYEGFDGKLDGMDEAVEIAKEAAKNTAYGVCNTGSEVAAKSVQVVYPQGGEFVLKDGTVISVRMTNANKADRPTLQVNGTGAKPIVTSGDNEAWWEAGQTVLFTYMDGNWCTMSAPVWTSSATIGDPRDYHIELKPNEFSMCVGGNKYINADPDGFQVGFTATVDNSAMARGRRNIHISDSEIAFRQGQTDYMVMDDTGIQIGMNDWKHVYIGTNGILMQSPSYNNEDIAFGWNNLNRAVISSSAGLHVDAGTGFGRFENSRCFMSLNDSAAYLGAMLGCHTPSGTDNTLAVGDRYYTNLRPWVMCSIVAQGTGSQYLQLGASSMGVADLSGYAFAVTNGDRNANDFFVVGTELVASSLWIACDRQIYGSVRLNILGVPVGAISSSNDASIEGPEIFDDPEMNPGPQIIDDSDEEAA